MGILFHRARRLAGRVICHPSGTRRKGKALEGRGGTSISPLSRGRAGQGGIALWDPFVFDLEAKGVVDSHMRGSGLLEAAPGVRIETWSMPSGNTWPARQWSGRSMFGEPDFREEPRAGARPGNPAVVRIFGQEGGNPGRVHGLPAPHGPRGHTSRCEQDPGVGCQGALVRKEWVRTSPMMVLAS